MNLRLFGAALLAVLATAGMANADFFTLVPNGDFSIADGELWTESSSATGGGAGGPITYPATGGNPDGYGQIDGTAGSWGVLINEGGTGSNINGDYAGAGGITLAALGLTAGETYTFQMDMILLSGDPGSIQAGLKMESWDAGGAISDSGDMNLSLTTAWATYQWDYTIEANATALKFVPVLAGQPGAASIGYDNVGYFRPGGAIPEPGSLALISLGVAGLVVRRRRK